MLTKTLIAVPMLALLTACSSGGGGNTSTANPKANIARVFSDGSGVARIVSSDGAKRLVMAPDVANQVANLNADGVVDVATTGDFIPGDEAPGGGKTFEGAITVDNVGANVVGVASPSEDAVFFYADFANGGAILEANGSRHGSLPSGEFTYTGTMTIGLRDPNPRGQYGSFTMVANFEDEQFDFSGSTQSSSLTGTGSINSENGTFGANSLNLTADGARTARMYGNIHGKQGETVSGVFHSNESNPVFAGAFVSAQ